MKLMMLVLCMLLIPVVYSCPPSMSEQVYMDEVMLTTEDFTFLEANLEPVDFNTNQAFPPRYFDIKDSPERLIIFANGVELSNNAISDLMFERYLHDYDTGIGKDVIVYNFPGDEFKNNELNEIPQLEHLRDAKVQIYLDDKLVGEYRLGHMEAQIAYCGKSVGAPFDSHTNNLIYTLIGIAVAGIVAFILLNRRHKNIRNS
jgi:hypothetical protein